MNQSLTDKTWVVLLGGGYKTYITESQAKMFMQATDQSIVLNDGRIIKSYIAVLPASEVEKDDKIKRGEWQCKHGYWHQKNQECGHGLR